MEIKQIVFGDGEVFGLGDDQKMYNWYFKGGRWVFYGQTEKEV